jgi:hypothetical protein
VDRRKLKFINLNHNYKPGLALEINPSPKERGKQINQRNRAVDTVICFTEVRFLENLVPIEVVTKIGSLSTLSLSQTVT